MRLSTPLVALSLAVPGLAGFNIGQYSTYISHSNSAQAASASAAYSSVNAAYDAALSSYQAEITKAPEYTSAWQILVAYQLTGKDVPAAVTATDKQLEYTTAPDWFKAMPTDARKYYESVFAKQDKIYQSAVSKLQNAAPAKSSRSDMLIGGAVVAGFVGAVGLL